MHTDGQRPRAGLLRHQHADHARALHHRVAAVDLQQRRRLGVRQQLEQRSIRFAPEQSPYCWAYQLIARGARLINQLDAYGMVLLPEFRDWTLPALRDAIDREFFLLSEAHYQRYIALSFLCDGLEGSD